MGGQLVNAHGIPLAPELVVEGPPEPAPSAEPEVAPEVASEPEGLPEGFPHRDALTAGGFVTLESVRDASDATLRALPTIGPAAVRAIRAALD